MTESQNVDQARTLGGRKLLNETWVWVDDSDTEEISTGYCIRELKRAIFSYPNIYEAAKLGDADIIHLNSTPFQRSDLRIVLSTDVPIIATHHGGYLWWEDNWRLLKDKPIFYLYKILFRASQYATRRISFSTEFTRRLAVEEGGIDRSRTTVIPLGRNERYQNVTETDTDDPFILLPVNNSNRRKNIPTVLETIRKTPEITYVLTGSGWKSYTDEIPPNGNYVGYVKEERLIDLYNRAVAVYLPTLFEGFGLPYVEAMGCGTAVLSSDIPAAREVCGQAAELFDDPMDSDEHARRIQRIMTDDTYREELERKGVRKASEYSWRKTAEQYLQLYAEVLDER